jgi:flagellin
MPVKTEDLKMSFSINTNLSSLNATRHLSKSSASLGKTFERLASGLRINGAKDDAAGMSISTRMTAQIRGMNAAIRNTNDAISLVQVAEGALGETTNSLQRIRELAVQSSNSTMTTTDRDDLQKEVVQLMAEIERIADNTKFNSQLLLDGNFTSEVFQVGANAGETLNVTITAAEASDLGLSTGAGLLGLSIGGGAGAITGTTAGYVGSAITRVDNALDSISDIRAELGAYQNRFESLISNLSNVAENTSAARSRVMDADIAIETANLTRSAIMQQAGTSILAQANQQPQIALQLLG